MEKFQLSKTSTVIISLVLLALFGWLIAHKNSGTVSMPMSNMEVNGEDVPILTGFNLPPGFALSLYAEKVPGARVMELDPVGNLIVSQTSEGKIVALIDTDNDRIADHQKLLASGLKNPHGLAVNCNNALGRCYLYVAESDALYRYSYNAKDVDGPALSGKEKLMDIGSSADDRHFTRSLLFLPSPNDNVLLVSVGSSCDVCLEEDPDHATILFYDTETGRKGVYAKGLRNAVFMTLHPVSGKVYATEMGRDNLGDDIPPDEINIIEQKASQPQNYGWPICYGKNIHDTEFDKNTYIRNPCMAPFETPSFIDLQAHSAPLGLAFIPEEGWPEDYWFNMLVSYHGSWNRSTPTGYKIARINMNAKGEYLGTEDFITGWTTDKKKGRPVDIKVLSGGTAYISDDTLGVIYRLWKTN